MPCNTSYLFECGVLHRLSDSRFCQNLFVDNRNNLTLSFCTNPSFGVGGTSTNIMCFTIQNLKVDSSSDSDYVRYSAELHSPTGEIIRVILSPNEQGIIAYNIQTEKMYPIVGVVEQKTLSELRDEDLIVLEECIEESR